jgi:hypothetical protein
MVQGYRGTSPIVILNIAKHDNKNISIGNIKPSRRAGMGPSHAGIIHLSTGTQAGLSRHSAARLCDSDLPRSRPADEFTCATTRTLSTPPHSGCVPKDPQSILSIVSAATQTSRVRRVKAGSEVAVKLQLPHLGCAQNQENDAAPSTCCS